MPESWRNHRLGEVRRPRTRAGSRHGRRLRQVGHTAAELQRSAAVLVLANVGFAQDQLTAGGRDRPLGTSHGERRLRLRLVKPLGFALEDKQLRRAGLDYHEF